MDYDWDDFSSSSICSLDKDNNENLIEDYKNMEKEWKNVTFEFKLRIGAVIILFILILSLEALSK